MHTQNTHTHTHVPPLTHTHTHTHKKRRLYMHVNFQVLSPCVAPLWSAGCLRLSTKQLVFNVQAQKQHSNPVTKTTVAVNTPPQEREISAWERYKASKHPGLGLIGYGKIMHNVSPLNIDACKQNMRTRMEGPTRKAVIVWPL